MVEEPQEGEQAGGSADRPDGSRPDPAADPRIEAGIDHLQTAAMELIGAARAFLDVIEDAVSDRDKMAEMADAVGSMAEAAARGVRRAGFDGAGGLGGLGGLDGFERFVRSASRSTSPTGSPPSPPSGAGAGDDAPPPGRVQHIRVS